VQDWEQEKEGEFSRKTEQSGAESTQISEKKPREISSLEGKRRKERRSIGRRIKRRTHKKER
jgi:hypothetical protein